MSDNTAYECRHCRTPLPASTLRSLRSWAATDGSPFPLGVKWIPEEQSYNFALYSKHAEQVELVFFTDGQFVEPVLVFQFEPLANKSGPIWHCRIPSASTKDAKYYAYRIGGPAQGAGFDIHAFDPEKLLLDPYARSLFFPPEFDREAARQSGSNTGRAPLVLLDECQCHFAWNGDHRVRHESDLIIYEMHVRGFTQNPNSAVTQHARGTFQGVVEKIPYLVDLGVTAVELMPVFQFDPQEGNYWGYMPLNFFAPHHAYSTRPDVCAQKSEFRTMVQALHSAGIEIILDVVFNHTCEGHEDGPTYSFKGIDNSTYYMMSPGRRPGYANFSGCGNTLHTANRAVRQLIVDSLRYWATEMHVDGFRFDLASVFARNSDGSINVDDPPLFAQIAGDPALAGVRLIAEPWDAGDGFLLGRRFPGGQWMQWNAQFRDTLQRFVRGDGGLVAGLMTRVYGSSDLFPDDREHAFRPFQSINYVTSHDGFTLYDLVSYNQKHNHANGHGNTDGAHDYSWNCGVEGDQGLSDGVFELRKQQVKNFFCLLMLSNGTPMFRMGDEFLQTQSGNNNPYNQDNATTWLDWQRLDEHRDVFRFFQRMIAFRKAHLSIGRAHFWREEIQWYGASQAVDMSASSHSLAYCLRGASQGDTDLYVMINASTEARRFGIHEGVTDHWRRVIDTARPSPHDIVDPGGEQPVGATFYAVQPHSVAVFVRCERALQP